MHSSSVPRVMPGALPVVKRTTTTPKAATQSIQFSKYHGLGNDFILIDNMHSPEPVITQEQATSLCDRHTGIGGDGVIFALPGDASHDLTMRIYNSDGSEPQMCGNGIRCLAQFIKQGNIGSSADPPLSSKSTLKCATLAGLIEPAIIDDINVTVDMGEPILTPSTVPTMLPATRDGAAIAAPLTIDGAEYTVSAVSMGNPHAVVYSINGAPVVLADVDANLETIGPKFGAHEAFPEGVNTEFVAVESRERVHMVVWERGAGRTNACGTGACALVVAGVLEGLVDRKCEVVLPGGPLVIEWREENNHVYMSGPAVEVFSGTIKV